MNYLINDELLSDIKLYVNVTWSEPNTDRKITNMIRMGMAYIDEKIGEPADFNIDGAPRSLLFEYVRYAYSEALDVFEDNFQSQIVAMVNNKELHRYVASCSLSEG